MPYVKRVVSHFRTLTNLKTSSVGVVKMAGKSQQVDMIVGMPASGKSSHAKKFIKDGYVWLNRDTIGGKVSSLVPLLENALFEGKSVVLDNTFPNKESRKPFIDAAHKAGVAIGCWWMKTSMEDAQFNAAFRIVEKYGKLLGPSEFKAVKSPNIFPPVVLFGFAKKFEAPTVDEGFDAVMELPFVRISPDGYTNKALILDYDDTLRTTISGNPYPTDTSDIKILPGRKEKLREYRDAGYVLLGVSNQSGVHTGAMSNGAAKACFDKTNKLLGLNIDYVYCPHQPAPISCYCRKPMCGWAVWFQKKYKLDLSQSIYVGDQTTDKTFAKRSGMKYHDQAEFFK